MPDQPSIIDSLARLVSYLRTVGVSGDKVPELLADVMELLSNRSFTITRLDAGLALDGKPVQSSETAVGDLFSRLKDHGISEIRLTAAPAPLDVMDLAQGIATDPGNTYMGNYLRDVDAWTVDVVGKRAAAGMAERRKVPIGDAVEQLRRLTHQKSEADGEEAMARRSRRLSRPMIEPAPNSLAGTVRKLRGSTDPDELLRGLTMVVNGVQESLQKRQLDEVIDALTTMISQEREAAESIEDVIRSRYELALARIFQGGALSHLSRYLLDPVYQRDVARIMLRAGSVATNLLLERLVQAKTFAERRAYIEVLRQMDEGQDAIISMMGHREWFVVRNVCDIAGELRLEEAIPQLGRAVNHDDGRVRRSAGIALAKIGTPAAARFLYHSLKDDDREVRLDIIKYIGGHGLAALAMPLMNATEDIEEDDELVDEIYRALGRIGTPGAVEALALAAQPVSRLSISRSKSSGSRAAAAEGLALAGGPKALELLEKLRKDRSKDVRQIAEDALQEAAARETG